MKRTIYLPLIFSLILCGFWACQENTEEEILPNSDLTTIENPENEVIELIELLPVPDEEALTAFYNDRSQLAKLSRGPISNKIAPSSCCDIRAAAATGLVGATNKLRCRALIDHIPLYSRLSVRVKTSRGKTVGFGYYSFNNNSSSAASCRRSRKYDFVPWHPNFKCGDTYSVQWKLEYAQLDFFGGWNWSTCEIYSQTITYDHPTNC